MKVSPIIQQQKNNLQSFKGLWGNPKEETYMLDSSYYIYEHRTVKEYHPFLDETQAEIEKVVSENEFFKGGLAVMANADSCKVVVRKALDFTKKEWEAYVANKLKGAMGITERLTADFIENRLRTLNLTKYIKK